MTGALVTGAASGLGRFLHRALGGEGLTRANAATLLKGPGYELIVHCAADARRAPTAAERSAQRRANVELTEGLCRVPHARFVLMSTSDVYAEDGGPWAEAGPLNPRNPYAEDKVAAEAAVLALTKRPLVLRLGTLLGPDARPNALSRLVDGTPMTLAADSRFSWLLHEDVLAFLTVALDRSLEGTYNVVPSRSATLAEAARALGRTPAWGAHLYRASEADGTKARAVCPALSRSALENAIAFARART